MTTAEAAALGKERGIIATALQVKCRCAAHRRSTQDARAQRYRAVRATGMRQEVLL